MEIPGAQNHKGKVFIYEFLGTSVLVYAVLASGGNMIAVSLTVLALIICCAQISGAHFNPCVTIGVYVFNRKWKKDLTMFILVLVAEFTGAFLGVFWTWLVVMPSHITNLDVDDRSIPLAWLVPLCPVGVNKDGTIESPCDTQLNRDRSAFFFQFFGSFIFVFLIMIVKSKPSFISGDNFLGAFVVATTLLSQIAVS